MFHDSQPQVHGFMVKFALGILISFVYPTCLRAGNKVSVTGKCKNPTGLTLLACT